MGRYVDPNDRFLAFQMRLRMADIGAQSRRSFHPLRSPRKLDWNACYKRLLGPLAPILNS